MISDYNRKDCPPVDTIKKIKKILKKYNIKVKEGKVININNSIYSVRIELKDFKGIGTNGKGITKDYALASAYAEFMERLQTKNLINNNFLNKISNHKLFEDEYYLEYNDFINKFQNNILLKDNKVIELLKGNSDYRYYTEFYDVINNKRIDLPIKLINLFSHSNGLCAGNSKEEALVQGICEIFERYSYKENLLKELDIPNIIIEDNEIHFVKQQLIQLEQLGFSYEIKDCSLNGLLPVVGMIIYDRNKENYLFSVGSDPNFEIALQRCITEILQGLLSNEIESKLKPIQNGYEEQKEKYGEDFLQANWLKCYTSNNGIHPNNFFVSKRTVRLKELNFSSKDNNFDAYNYIINILNKNKFDLFVKDYSVFGFDTYKIYIPNMSNVDTLDELKLKLYSNIEYYKDAYYNFADLYGKNNKEFENVFYKLSKSLRFSNLIVPYNIFGVNHYVENDFVKLNYFYLLLIELIMNGKKTEVSNIIEDKMKNNNIDKFENDYLEYLYAKLNDKYSEKEYSKFIRDDVDLLLKDTRRYLLKLHALQCPNCNACNSKRKCKYKKWIKLNNVFMLK